MDATAPACAAQCAATILENRSIARDTFLMRLEAPTLARAIVPGQFVMVRPAEPGACDPLLGRPFAVYEVGRDASGQATTIDVVYLILGRGTAVLSQKHPGDLVQVWGPLGNGFGPPPSQPGPVAFVAGGIGQTPFLALARWWRGQAAYGPEATRFPTRPDPVRMYYGVRSADLLAGVADFQAAGLELQLATDDGSQGHHGFVTDLLARDLEAGYRPARIVACGPPPMLAATARLAQAAEIPCDLSLENHMACGFGVCFSCVAPIRQPDGSTDLRRVCVEGPIFPAESVVF